MKSLSIQPSGSLDALGALGVLRGGFVQALIGMGESDAHTRKDELLAFLDSP